MPEVVITCDWTMMSNHHARDFLGFGATTPAYILPEAAYRWMFFPPIPCDEEGHPAEAPYGMRKIEAALLDAGVDAAVIHPSYLDRYLPDGTKLLLLSGHDYLGLNPPSTTFAGVMGGRPPLNRVNFMRMLRQPWYRAAREKGIPVIAGGACAWQLSPATRQKLTWIDRFLREVGDIDCVVEGEGDRFVREIVPRALRGEKLPRHVVLSPREAPKVPEIAPIRRPSVNGLVEIGRGCPRGCSFCSVTTRPTRWYPLDTIERELAVNASAGMDAAILHSDDVLLYGSPNVLPREEKLLPLLQLAKRYHTQVGWSHVAVASIMTRPTLLPKIRDTLVAGGQRTWGAEIGIETGSPRLITAAMPGKVAPFRPSQWPELVVQAAGLLNDNAMHPACTFIVGLPQETEDDILRTTDLIDDLWDFHALLVPMFFVPLGRLTESDWYRRERVTEAQKELFARALTHGLRQAKLLASDFFLEPTRTKGAPSAPFRAFVEFLTLVARMKGLWRPPERRGNKPLESPLRHPERLPVPTMRLRET